MLASILLCTIDRYDLTVQCVGGALQSAGYPFELLCVDNGSIDQHVIEYIAGLNPVYHRLNKTNEGYAPMLNQMLLRSKGDYLCVIDNDIQLPNNWLRKLVEVNQAIPDSGMSGYYCVLDRVEETVLGGMGVHVQERIHGTKFFNRGVLDKVGYLCDDFNPYGNEEVEYNRRVIMAGFTNYYLAKDVALHLGEDSGEQSPYRKMKWDSLKNASDVLTRRFEYLRETGDYYLPPPELR